MAVENSITPKFAKFGKILPQKSSLLPLGNQLDPGFLSYIV